MPAVIASRKSLMSSWFQQIDAAKSPSEIVTITRDYLATWTPDELARLPEQCRPGRIRDEQDIDQLHVRLVEEYGRSRPNDETLSALQRITSLIVRASVRIAQLQSEEDSPATDDEPPRPSDRRSPAARNR
jgi:hypothetical protein